MAAFGLIACDPAATSTTPPESTPPASTPTESEESGVTITYQVDGKTVHAEKLAETGGVPANYAYTPSEGEFVGWYLTPTFSRIYDFKTALTEDTTLFGAVSIYEEDTRVFYLAGAGTSPILSTSSWGDNPTDAHKLTKEANKNVFTITADFYANDQFQITSFKETETDPYAWDWQYGVGYIINASELADIVEGAGGITASNRKSNIKILQDGNYTITLKTYPDHIDPEGTEHINNLDNITIKRNGDPVEEKPETTYAYYIKGKNITNWQSQLNATTPTLISQFIGNFNNFGTFYFLRGGIVSEGYFLASDTDLLINWLYNLSISKNYYGIGAAISLLIFIITSAISLLVYVRSGSYKKEDTYR